MKGYNVCGIQQIGIGVENLGESWKWYVDKFGMDCRIFEEEAVAKLMLPYTGGKPRSRHAVLAINMQSGGGFEIWQHTEREPVYISGEIMLGDLGITACKMKVKNIDEAFSFYKNNNVTILGEALKDPAGNRTFFLKDPYGSIFQMLVGNNWFINENKVSGGSYGAIIGVSNIEKAKSFYSDILGYDIVAYDSTGIFPDLVQLPGGNKPMRRVLLRRSEPETGPFSRILGKSEIELICTDTPGRKIYEGRYWGDPGFIQLCYDIVNMKEMRAYCSKQGYPFRVDSMHSHNGNSFDMGEAAGHFAYIEDPDGTLIELVETHKIPIFKKLGWYLDLRKRKHGRPLPEWILKAMRFSKVKIK